MVQFAFLENRWFGALKQPFDRYEDEFWKVRSTNLHDRAALRKLFDEVGYHYPKSASYQELVRHYHRWQRGFPQYTRYGVRELRGFVEGRKLAVPRSANKGALVAALEQADEDATFPKFLKLPPEVRNIVYEMHFDSILSEKLIGPYLPPITRVCRQIRLDTVKLFTYESIPKMKIWWPMEEDFRSDFPYELSNTAKEHLGCIRRLYIHIEGIADLSRYYGHAFALVTLGEGDGKSTVEFTRGQPFLNTSNTEYASVPLPQELQERLGKQLGFAVERVDARPGRRQLHREDLRSFYQAFLNTWKKWNREDRWWE